MLLTFKKFYYENGIRKLPNFLDPSYLNFNIESLCKNSILHYTDVDTYPTIKLPVLQNAHDVDIINIIDYVNPVGKFIKKQFTENILMQDLSKTYPNAPISLRYKAERNLTTNSNYCKNTIVVYNYNQLEKRYEYTYNHLTPFYTHINLVNTITKTISDIELLETKESMNHFLDMVLPNDIYSINVYERHLYSEPSSTLLKLFHTPESLFLLELLKLLGDTPSNSLLYPLTTNVELASRINFIIKYKENSVLLNLKALLSFSKDNKLENNNKISNRALMLMILNLSTKIINKHQVDLNTDIINAITSDAQNDKITTLEEVTPVDDETEKQIEVIDTVTKTANSYKYIKSDDEDPISVTRTVLDNLVENKQMDRPKKEKLIKIMDDFKNKPALDGNGTMKDMLVVKDDELKLTKEDGVFKFKTPAVTSDEDKRDILSYMTKKYVKEQLDKDIVRTLVKLQPSGLIIKDIKKETTDNLLGSFTTYSMEVSDKGKSSYTIKQIVPNVSTDGTFMMSGNTYRLTKQRVELPIKKISRTKVVLTSATSKLNIESAPLTKYDAGYRLKKILNNLDTVSNLLFGTANIMDTDLPDGYYIFSRYIKSFKFKSYNFIFNYHSRGTILDKVDLNKIEKDKSVLIGKAGNKPILLNKDNHVIIDNKDIGTMYEILDIDRTKLTQYTLLSLFNTLVPIGIVLLYYKGLDGLMEMLNTSYEIYDKSNIKVDDNIIKLKLADCAIGIKTDTPLQKIILLGLDYKPKVTKKMLLEQLNDKNSFNIYFREIDLNLATVTNIQTLELLFIDSVTASILKSMNEPTTFPELLVEASKMLISDKYENPKSIETQAIRGYERIPQLFHKVLINAIKKKTAEEHFGRSKLVVDPYSIWRELNEDAASALVDDFNPIAYIKQNEEVTFLGTGGMRKETITIKDVGFNKNDLNVISEGVKDNTDVGMTASLSANPQIRNMRGMTKDKPGTETLSNLFSTNTMLAPFLLADDTKRIIYSNIQAGAVIPVSHPKIYPVRTPYANILPYKLPANFIAHCEDDGVVTSVSKTFCSITFKKLGKQNFKFPDWTSKEESGSTYIHRMRCDLVKGDKINTGDVIYYDTGFFEKDMFDNSKVIYRVGTYVNTVFISGEYTREDSFMISDKLSEEIASETIYINDKTLVATDKIINPIDIGVKVSPDDTLFTIVSPLVGDEKLTKETLDLMHGFVNVAPKANYEGTLVKVKVYYNCELKDLSASLKKLVKQSEPFMVNDTSGKQYDGKVNSSFSVNGVPLEPNGVYIKYYIATNSKMLTGDKGVFSNQLKATVTGIMDYKVVDEFDRDIDAIFEYRGIYQRIVPSSDLMSSTATVLKAITDKAVAMYFGK